MKKLIALFCFLSISSTVFAQANEVSTWQKNYDKLIKVLSATKSVGDCATTVSGNPESGTANSFNLNILTTKDGLKGFTLDSPKVTSGASRVIFNNAQKLITYSVSDFVGWTNLIVLVNAKKQVIGLKLNKTLPSGVAYDTGATCGVQIK